MPIDSVETLLTILRRAQLLTPEEVEEVARTLGPRFDDPHALAEYLRQVEWLTAYQVQRVFADAWEELSVGPYVILDRLGAGGVGEVFKAWDTVKGRFVALKVLDHLSRRDDAVTPFHHELQAVLRLAHANVIKIFDAGRVGPLAYVAMECVDGLDLDRYIRQVGPLPVEQACDYARQAALGLQHAHQLGLVHRDVKPANLFLINPPPAATAGGGPPRRGPDPVVKVLDWGLARLRPEEGEAVDASGPGREAEKGDLLGTADYLAPEQARDPGLVDIRADVYSLGCALFFLLTGQPPFPGPSLMQKLLQHQEAERPRVQDVRADVPADLAAVVERMMARRPEERYPIPLLAAAALRRFCPGAAGRR
jgi:serine/threonine-protein kinase